MTTLETAGGRGARQNLVCSAVGRPEPTTPRSHGPQLQVEVRGGRLWNMADVASEGTARSARWVRVEMCHHSRGNVAVRVHSVARRTPCATRATRMKSKQTVSRPYLEEPELLSIIQKRTPQPGANGAAKVSSGEFELRDPKKARLLPDATGTHQDIWVRLSPRARR